MAKKLSLEIKLEGGKEIKRELAEMGEEGKKAFGEISKAAKEVGGFDKLDPNKLAQVNSELKKIGVSAAEIDNVSDAVNRATRTERLVGTVRAVENGFATLTSTVKLAALAFGPMGLAFAVVAEKAIAMIGALGGASEAINKVGDAAAKAGLSIQKYDQIRAGLERGGVSAGGIEEALQKIAEVGEKGKLDQVAEAVKKLQAVMAQGSDPRTSSALQQLLQLAQGFGPVADAAKQALADLNISLTAQEQRLQQMASSGVQNLSQLSTAASVEGRAFATALQQIGVGTDTAGATLQAFIRQLEGIHDPAQRNVFAFQQMGAAGLELAKGIQTGAISSKQSIDQVTATLSQASLDWAAKVEQSKNTMSAAWARMWQTGDLSQLGTVFSEIGTQMQLAIERASETYGPLFAQIKEGAGSVWHTFSSTAQTAISAVSHALDGLLVKLQEAAKLVGAVGGGGGGSGGGSGGAAPKRMAGGGLISGRGSGTSDSNLAWVSRGEYIVPARVVRRPGVLSFLESLRGGGGAAKSRDGLSAFAGGGEVSTVRATSIEQIVEAINSLAESISDAFDKVAKEDTVREGFAGMGKNFQTLQGDIREFSKSIFDAIRDLTAEISKKGGAEKHAFGGLIGGRGSGISDSNLAWVSRGEHIMPAAAVRQPGVLAFLEALRRSGGNLSRVLDGMGRFALGGPVGLPAFASGNVGTMSNVTIQFPGLPAIGGLRASSQVVEELQRAAAMAQVRSGGRKPSRYR